MHNNLIWLRSNQPAAMCFSVIFDSDRTTGAMASWETQLSPSEKPGAQPATFPVDRHVRGLAGVVEIETPQGKFELRPGGSTFIPAHVQALFRCKDREVGLWETVSVPGGAEAFFEAIIEARDENEINEQAKDYGIEMYWTPPQPPLPPAIKALENRISYPMRASFSL